MHDTKTAGVDLRRTELELLIELLASAYASAQNPERTQQLSSLYDKLSRAKGGL